MQAGVADHVYRRNRWAIGLRKGANMAIDKVAGFGARKIGSYKGLEIWVKADQPKRNRKQRYGVWVRQTAKAKSWKFNGSQISVNQIYVRFVSN